jgi:AraC-like DNA-binding protein
MNPFHINRELSRELEEFPYIHEFALRKNTSIQLDSFNPTTSNHLRIYYIMDGKFEWIINERHQILYPGDVAIVLPGQTLMGQKGFLDIGSLCWIHIQIERIEALKGMIFGGWSGLSASESLTISKILHNSKTIVLVKMNAAIQILRSIYVELFQQQIGYATRVNHLIDELLILIARQTTHQNNLRRDFPQTFMKLEESLRQNLAHQWTVEEMAAMVGLGTTAFSEKVKKYTGFSPLNYIINLRISEAIKQLKRSDSPVTTIALDTGFYSSQHFSTTFKKLTGYTPGEFRKMNSQNQ